MEYAYYSRLADVRKCYNELLLTHCGQMPLFQGRFRDQAICVPMIKRYCIYVYVYVNIDT